MGVCLKLCVSVHKPLGGRRSGVLTKLPMVSAVVAETEIESSSFFPI